MSQKRKSTFSKTYSGGNYGVHFPDDGIQLSKKYFFFDSLLRANTNTTANGFNARDLGQQARDLIQTNVRNSIGSSEKSEDLSHNFLYALEFLRIAAQTERDNELRFFSSVAKQPERYGLNKVLAKQIADIQDTSISASYSSNLYTELIFIINQYKQTAKNFITNLKYTMRTLEDLKDLYVRFNKDSKGTRLVTLKVRGQQMYADTDLYTGFKNFLKTRQPNDLSVSEQQIYQQAQAIYRNKALPLTIQQDIINSYQAVLKDPDMMERFQQFCVQNFEGNLTPNACSSILLSLAILLCSRCDFTRAEKSLDDANEEVMKNLTQADLRHQMSDFLDSIQTTEIQNDKNLQLLEDIKKIKNNPILQYARDNLFETTEIVKETDFSEEVRHVMKISTQSTWEIIKFLEGELTSKGQDGITQDLWKKAKNNRHEYIRLLTDEYIKGQTKIPKYIIVDGHKHINNTAYIQKLAEILNNKMQITPKNRPQTIIQKNFLTEIVPAILESLNSQLGAGASVGKHNKKADNISIELPDAEYELNVDASVFNEMSEALLDLYAKDLKTKKGANYKTFQQLVSGYKISTTEAQPERKVDNKVIQQLNINKKQIEKVSDTIQQQIDALDKSFFIETSVKSYIGDYNTSNGFIGGSLGPHVHEQIWKLIECGGISKEDAEWLEFAVYNVGVNGVATDAKPVLEKYFATAAALALFDTSDGVKEQVEAQMQGITKQTKNNLIHLYLLNGIYVPASYVLQRTYDELSKALSNNGLLRKTRNKGSEARIYNRVGPKDIVPAKKNNIVAAGGWNITTSPQQWTGTFAKHKDDVYIRVTFMAGLLDLLHTLNNLSSKIT